MILYRPNRYSLSDSMEEARAFATEEDMKAYISAYCASLWGYPPLSEEEITISGGPCENLRSGWMDERIVCVGRMGGRKYEPPAAIGYCATLFRNDLNPLFVPCEKCGKVFLRQRGQRRLCRACSKKEAQKRWRRKKGMRPRQTSCRRECDGCVYLGCIHHAVYYCRFYELTGTRRPRGSPCPVKAPRAQIK